METVNETINDSQTTQLLNAKEEINQDAKEEEKKEEVKEEKKQEEKKEEVKEEKKQEEKKEEVKEEKKSFTIKAFHKKYSSEERSRQSEQFRKKYNNSIPILVENRSSFGDNGKMQHKYLVPEDMTLGHFSFVIRSRMQLKKEDAIFLHVGMKETIVPSTQTIGQIHKNHSEQGFLYVIVSQENVFGSF